MTAGALLSALGGAPWSPKRLSVASSFAFLAPRYGRQDRITLTSGKVSAISDYRGGPTVLAQATSTKRPSWNNVDAIDGWTTLRMAYAATNANASALTSATGGITDGSHTIVAIVKFLGTGTLWQTSNQSIGHYGGVSGESSVLGTAGNALWVGGGPNHGAPGAGAAQMLEAYNAGRFVELRKTYSGGVAKGFVNGIEVASGSVSLAPASPAITLGEWTGADGYGSPDLDIVYLDFLPGLLTDSDLDRSDVWKNRRFPSSFPRQTIYAGDSRTFAEGYGGTTEEQTWRYLVSVAQGRHMLKHAKASAKMDDIINGWLEMPSLAFDLTRSQGRGCWVTDRAYANGGVNDLISTADTVDTIWNKKVAEAQQLSAAGVSEVVWVDIFKTDLLAGARETDRQTLNTRGGNAVGSLFSKRVPLDAVFPNPADTGLFADGTHLNAAGNAAHAAAVLAA